MTKKAAKWWLISAGVVIPVLYVLSPGPVIAVLDSGLGGGVVEDFFQVLYAPLEWLYGEVEWVEAFYDWWFGVFEV